jgi:tight adherence protein B
LVDGGIKVLIAISMITFVTILMLTMLIYNVATADLRVIKARVNRYTRAHSAPVSGGQSGGAGAAGTPKLAGWRQVIRSLSRYLEAPQLTRQVEQKLVQAGWPLRGSEYWVIALGLAAAGGFIVFLISNGRVSMGVLGAAAGFTALHAALYAAIAKRRKLFNHQLGDALILIANSLRTGYSFMQAIEMVSREMPQPIGGEFARVLREMNLGVVTEDAMNSLAKRVDSDDLDLVITAVLIQRQIGGNLAEILDNIGGTIRERIRIRGEIKTLTAQGRISGMIIGALPFFIGLAIFATSPSYVSVLFTHPAGHAMLGGAVVSQLLGVILIRKIVNIDV